jgi:hypothetical protein
MKTQDIEKLLIGSIKEILQDPTYFYHSTVGPDYCHLTAVGNSVIIETVNILGSRMLLAMALEDVERSSKQSQREQDRDLREIRREIDAKIQKALDNPLAGK